MSLPGGLHPGHPAGAGAGDLSAVGWIVAYLAVLAGVLLWRFRAGAWRRLQLVEPSPP